MSPFFQACGGIEAIRVALDHEEQAFMVPVILAGRDPRCDLVLESGTAVALAFVLYEGRLLALPLMQAGPIVLNDGLLRAGWIDPGDTIQIGPHTLTPLNPHQPGSREPDLDPLANNSAFPTDLHFEPSAAFRSRKIPTKLAISPRLMLIGRGEPARFKINYDGVEPVHALVIRTGVGPWLVDLTRRDRTLVNDGPVTAARLRTGDRAGIGSVELIAHVATDQVTSLASTTTDSVGPILQQVAQFQQQTFEQFREMLGSMTQMFGAVLNEHRQFVKEEFARLERSVGPSPGELPQLGSPPPAVPPPAEYTPPATVTPIPSAGPGHSAPPPNVELHAWLQDQVENLEKAETSRWKKLLERFRKN